MRVLGLRFQASRTLRNLLAQLAHLCAAGPLHWELEVDVLRKANELRGGGGEGERGEEMGDRKDNTVKRS